MRFIQDSSGPPGKNLQSYRHCGNDYQDKRTANEILLPTCILHLKLGRHRSLLGRTPTLSATQRDKGAEER